MLALCDCKSSQLNSPCNSRETSLTPTHLSIYFPLVKYILERNVKLAHLILAKAIMIPADTLQQRHPDHGHFECDVPFWVQGFGYCRGRLSCIAKRNN